MGNSNRTWLRRGHDPWSDLDGRAVRRQRRFKAALDFGILAVAILMLALVFGTQPVVGF